MIFPKGLEFYQFVIKVGRIIMEKGDCMGIFDFLFSGGAESQLKKHIQRLNNLNTPQEERMASAQWLAQNKSPEAIDGLLRRFSLTYEKQMKDIEEKEYLYKLLLGIGADTIEPTKNWLKRNRNFAFPLRLLENLQGEDDTVTFLIELLSLENDLFKPEKKRQLIIKLGDYTDSRIIEAVGPHIQDFDEEVRLAALETLHNQNDSQCHQLFLDALCNPKEESNRLKIRIAEIFEQRNWDLKDRSSQVQEITPYGWIVNNNRLQRG